MTEQELLVDCLQRLNGVNGSRRRFGPGISASLGIAAEYPPSLG